MSKDASEKAQAERKRNMERRSKMVWIEYTDKKKANDEDKTIIDPKMVGKKQEVMLDTANDLIKRGLAVKTSSPKEK